MEPQNQAEKPQNIGAFLFASLYLTLLVFFIVLVSMSKPDHIKQKKITQSIQENFNNYTLTPTLSKGKDALKPFGTKVKLNPHFALIKKLVKKDIEFFDLEVNDSGDTMHVTFPVTHFFRASSPVMKSSKRAFLKQLASIITMKKPGYHIESEITFETTGKTTIYDTKTQLSLIRAGFLIRKLLAWDLPKKHLSIGFKEGKSHALTFTFYWKLDKYE